MAVMQIEFKFKEFKIFLWKKRRFRLGRDLNLNLSSKWQPGLESWRSRKRLFFHEFYQENTKIVDYVFDYQKRLTSEMIHINFN